MLIAVVVAGGTEAAPFITCRLLVKCTRGVLAVVSFPKGLPGSASEDAEIWGYLILICGLRRIFLTQGRIETKVHSR